MFLDDLVYTVANTVTLIRPFISPGRLQILRKFG